jgi:hypothetical protein
VKPVTVNVPGLFSEIWRDGGDVTPDWQIRLTVTWSVLLSRKSLCTVNSATLRVLVIVQEPSLSSALQEPADE